jgi:orotidine-5'-phosphate decarboxylase
MPDPAFTGPGFGARLQSAFERSGHLCLGIDAHAQILGTWGLPDNAAGAREFGLRCVEIAAGRIGIVKPQIAFYERHGAAGYAALEEVLAAARAAGLIVIADVKRGDIGSTVAAYGEPWLTPGSPLEADAITVVAYQGVGSLDDPIARARAFGKGLFVLAATSNPQAAALQTAIIGRGPHDGSTVAAGIVGDVGVLNRTDGGDQELGSFGVVIGATVSLADYRIEPAWLRGMPVLAPGFGEQGGRLDDVGTLFGEATGSVVANIGRAVLGDGPGELPGRLDEAAVTLAEAIGA